MSFDHFNAAQDADFATAIAELRAGRKTSHWIWYIFPQLTGLGSSSMARAYSLRDVAEAIDYLRHPVLRARLAAVTSVVADQLRGGVNLVELMGGRLDAMKLVSSVTLFEIATARLAGGGEPTEWGELRDAIAVVLRAAQAQGFTKCTFTLRAAAHA